MKYIDSPLYPSPYPSLGMGCTVHYGSSCYPATIVKVSPSGKTITIQSDEARRLGEHDQNSPQVWDIRPDVEGKIETATLRKYGGWKISKSDSLHVVLGTRSKFIDFGI